MIQYMCLEDFWQKRQVHGTIGHFRKLLTEWHEKCISSDFCHTDETKMYYKMSMTFFPFCLDSCYCSTLHPSKKPPNYVTDMCEIHVAFCRSSDLHKIENFHAFFFRNIRQLSLSFHYPIHLLLLYCLVFLWSVWSFHFSDLFFFSRNPSLGLW